MNRLQAAFAAFFFVCAGLYGAARFAPQHNPSLASPVVYVEIDNSAGTELGHGTGFNIGNGQFITAAHVTAEVKDGNTIVLKTNKGDRLPADVVWSDQKHDVALVRLHDTSKASTIRAASPFCKLPDVHVGDRVVSIGYPLNLGLVTTVGRVAKDNFVDGEGVTTFLADLTIAPGNSGGPVIDANGYVAGMADAIVVIPLDMIAKSVIHLSYIVPRSAICADIASGGQS